MRAGQRINGSWERAITALEFGNDGLSGNRLVVPARICESRSPRSTVERIALNAAI